MNALFYDKIKNFMTTAKGSGKKVAAFLLEHTEESAFLGIAELASAIHVSPGTVSRTAREMGFRSFPDLQEQIRQVIRRNIVPVAKLHTAGPNFPDPADVVARDVENVRSILQRNLPAAFEDASKLLAKAPRVHILGLRSSFPGAYYLSLCLQQLREEVFLMDAPGGSLPESVMRLRANDLVVLLSFPRYSRDTLLLVEEARNMGCALLTITDSVFSPLAVQATAAIFAPYESTSFFNSNVAVFTILDILLSQAGHLLQKKGATKLQRHNDLLERWSFLAKGKDIPVTPAPAVTDD